jgi:UDP-N-acetylmuramoyl-L-alanyl-D-glutamate--2,6-diaminopimelate ligase
VILFEEIPAILGELLLEGPPPSWPRGEVGSVEQDSRRVRGGGTIFVAIPGTTGDGRDFLADAASRGAQGAIGLPPVPAGGIPYLSVREPRKAVAILSARIRNDPSHEIDVAGITGTNGKTTTSWLLQSIWEECGLRAAVSGTLGAGDPRGLTGATHTTPDAPRFQEALRDLVDRGFRAVAAEVSSHALDQDRVYATRFRCAVFTNLTRDHLDYHGTLDAYLDAKRKLFRPEGRGDAGLCPSVVNLDDPAGRMIVAGGIDPVRGYGEAPDSFVRLESIDARADGLALRVRGPRGVRVIRSPLIGGFNGSNVLAAYTAAVVLDLPEEGILSALARGIRVPGRMERVDRGQPFLLVVDYAHTPDALARTLDALRRLTNGELIVLFGCGGNRDHGKRPEMGAIAAARADRIVLTNDNPRSEDPQAILDAIEAGVRSAGREPDRVEPDRALAIRAALGMARDRDTVLLAGKGHETYQETAAGRREFDDRSVAAGVLSDMGWSR